MAVNQIFLLLEKLSNLLISSYIMIRINIFLSVQNNQPILLFIQLNLSVNK